MKLQNKLFVLLLSNLLKMHLYGTECSTSFGKRLMSLISLVQIIICVFLYYNLCLQLP